MKPSRESKMSTAHSSLWVNMNGLLRKITAVLFVLLLMPACSGCGALEPVTTAADLEGDPAIYTEETAENGDREAGDTTLSFSEASVYAATVLDSSFSEAMELLEEREELPEATGENEELLWPEGAFFRERTETPEGTEIRYYAEDGRILYDETAGIFYGYYEDGSLAYTEQPGGAEYYVTTQTGDGSVVITETLTSDGIFSFTYEARDDKGITEFLVTLKETDYERFREVFESGEEAAYLKSGIRMVKLLYGREYADDGSCLVTVSGADGTYLYAYDETGLLLSEEYTFYENGSLKRSVRSFDSRGQTVSEELYEASVLISSVQYVNSYNPSGELISVESYEDEVRSGVRNYSVSYDGRNRRSLVRVTDELGNVLSETETIYRD